MSTLERAIAIAAEAHAGVLDKGNAPYILHPLRLLLAMTSTDARIVAALHDVIEDCPDWTFERLAAEGFSVPVLAGLRSVTKSSPTENYDTFIDRAIADPIGRLVKLADLRDNSNLDRIAAPTQKDRDRLAKYQRSIARIEAALASDHRLAP